MPNATSPVAAVIFDLDGLLIDSEPLWREAEIKVFRSLGIPMTDAMALESTGIRIGEVVRSRYDSHPWEGPTIDEVRDRILDEVERLLAEKGRLLPGASALFERFETLNIPMAIASSSPPRIIEAATRHFNLERRIPIRHSAEHEAEGKPDPAVYLSTARMLAVSPSSCLAFEDSAPGVEAALTAGMCCVAVPAAHDRQHPQILKAHFVLDSLEAFEDVHLNKYDNPSSGN